jgi:hypothetical protein
MGHESDQSPPTSEEVKKMWIYASISPNAFVTFSITILTTFKMKPKHCRRNSFEHVLECFGVCPMVIGLFSYFSWSFSFSGHTIDLLLFAMDRVL